MVSFQLSTSQASQVTPRGRTAPPEDKQVAAPPKASDFGPTHNKKVRSFTDPNKEIRKEAAYLTPHRHPIGIILQGTAGVPVAETPMLSKNSSI